jgi:hypothetical protein
MATYDQVEGTQPHLSPYGAVPTAPKQFLGRCRVLAIQLWWARSQRYSTFLVHRSACIAYVQVVRVSSCVLHLVSTNAQFVPRHPHCRLFGAGIVF